MSLGHECFVIHRLEKRASRGLGTEPNGPPKAQKYRTAKTQRRIRMEMGMKIVELPLKGQSGESMSSKSLFYLLQCTADCFQSDW